MLELSELVARQQALIGGSDVTVIDAGLADPLGQSAVGHAQSLGSSTLLRPSKRKHPE